MNTLDLTFNRIVLTLDNPLDWALARQISGQVEEITPGKYELALSSHNMHRIARYFDGARKPVVRSGQQFLDKLKDRLRDYKHHRERTTAIAAQERYPVEPNGKFIPYAHQTKIIGALLENPFLFVGAGCGLGKTGSELRAMEILIDRGEVSRGKILITAPLSIIETSWLDDSKKFTALNLALLWTPMSNKTSLDQKKEIFFTHGAKPPGTVAVKNKTGIAFKHNVSGEIKEKINALDGKPADWTKYRTHWKAAIDLLGVETAFGPVTARIQTTEKTREQFIKDQLARTDVDGFLINHDGVRIYENILKDHGFEWVVVDESTKIKSAKSKVWASHVAISWKAKRRNALSGTPNPNGFQDLWSQFYFLDRGMTLEPVIRDYLHTYFRAVPVGNFSGPGGKDAVKYELRDIATRNQLVERVRSVGVWLEQRDCIDLPPRTDMVRKIHMTSEQEAAYDQMVTDLVAELRDKVTNRSVRSDAVNVLAQIMRLRQITSGFLVNRAGEVSRMSNNPKLADLDDYLEELSGQKCTVVCQFKEEIREVLERYQHLNAQAIYGDIDPEDRPQLIRDFQDKDHCRLMVLQPKAAAHGITLTAASHMVLLSLSYDYDAYHQIIKRIERIGQKHPQFIAHFLACYSDGEETIDSDLLDVLNRKDRDRQALFKPDATMLTSEQDTGDIAEQLVNNIMHQAEKASKHAKHR